MNVSPDHSTLIVSKSTDTMQHLRDLARQFGSQLIDASSVAQASEQLEAAPVSLIVLAMTEINEDPTQLIQTISDRHSGTPVLFLHDRQTRPSFPEPMPNPHLVSELPLGPHEIETILLTLMGSRTTTVVGTGNNRAVLLVDDDEALLKVLEFQLRAVGNVDLFTAHDGESAYDEACRIQPDVIVTDFNMPRMTGEDLTRKIRNNPNTTDAHIIMLSTIIDSPTRARLIESGADDFISKPHDSGELIARIRAGLRQTETVRRLRRSSAELEDSNRRLTLLHNRLVHQQKIAGIGMLAGGVAHEFNNIMTAIMGHAEYALMENNPDAMRQALQISMDSGKRAIEITKTLSGFAGRPDEDTTTQDIDLESMIEDIVRLIRDKAAADHVTILTEFAQIGTIQIDGDGLKDVFLNLINNALEAMAPDGGSLEIRTERTKDRIHVIFEDTGCGIDEDDIDYIFDPFYTTKGIISGGSGLNAGMGLSMCYGVVESCGGYIDVRSRVGEGTTFTVVLPA